jgi:3-oxo-5alpha-steroid 4-dehydrogenase
MNDIAVRPGSDHWYSAVEAPEAVASADAVPWDAEADFVVVGYGGAGIAAAVEAAEQGLQVVALDLASGGGSTAINGGIYYAGGGTAIQRQAGVQDSVEAMFQYLRGETQGVVSDATLRKFCEASEATLDWLTARGVRFDPTRYDQKTSYPPPGYYLYHSDSSLAAARAAVSRPAPRGHKVVTPGAGNVALGLGKGLTEPLAATAARRGVRFEPCSEVRRLVRDAGGRIVGVAALQFADAALRAQYARLQAQATKFAILLPPAFPGAGITLGIARWYERRAKALAGRRVLRRIRARRGVCLSAGGFVFNPDMVRHYAPKYASGMPLGQPGDNGSGIRLGQSAGGAVSRMHHFSAWRFIRPPAGLSWGPIVNARGARFIDETVYGAATGYELIEHHDGRAWIVLDQALYDETLAQTKSKELYNFQSGPAFMALKFARVKAPTLEGLAQRLGFDATTFAGTIAAYNRVAQGEAPDAFGKAPAECRAIQAGPFYAIDIGVGSKLFPLPVLSLGGLVVNEDTGAVLDAAGRPIAGLYAAGRNAIGICSHLYVSGLSAADCVYSGRRAAVSAARD